LPNIIENAFARQARRFMVTSIDWRSCTRLQRSRSPCTSRCTRPARAHHAEGGVRLEPCTSGATSVSLRQRRAVALTAITFAPAIDLARATFAPRASAGAVRCAPAAIRLVPLSTETSLHLLLHACRRTPVAADREVRQASLTSALRLLDQLRQRLQRADVARLLFRKARRP
jgi:hypothetical protein